MPFHPSFSYSDGDLILRASQQPPSDSKVNAEPTEFRVHKVLLTLSSPILKDAISLCGTPFGIVGSTLRLSWDKRDDIPTLCFPEDSTTVLALLLAIYPVSLSPAIGTLDRLTVILKKSYQYQIVCAQQRYGDQWKSLITASTSFRAYALACAHGLQHEAEVAARRSLPLTMSTSMPCISDLKGATGADLSDLWNFRSEVFRHTCARLEGLASDSRFRKLWEMHAASVTSGCYEGAAGGAPHWFHDHIRWVREIAQDTGDQACLRIDVGNILGAKYVTHLDCDDCDFCEEISFEFSEAIYSLLQTIADEVCAAVPLRMSARNLSNEPLASNTPRYYGSPFDQQDSDLVLRSADEVDFLVCSGALRMVCSDSIFRVMLSIPQGDSALLRHPDDFVDGLPCIRMPEDTRTLYLLLSYITHVPLSRPQNLEEAIPLLSALQKYDLGEMASDLRKLLAADNIYLIDPENAFRVFGLAHKFHLEEEALIAAHMTLRLSLTFEKLSLPHVKEMPSADALHALTVYHAACKDAVTMCLDTFSQEPYSLEITPVRALINCICVCSQKAEITHAGSRQRLQLNVPPWWHLFFANARATFIKSPFAPFDSRLVISRSAFMNAYTQSAHGPMCTIRSQIPGAIHGLLDHAHERIISTVEAAIMAISSPIF